MRAGILRRRLAFGVRAEGAGDGFGNSQVGWTESVTVAAAVDPQTGGETFVGERLEGRNPVRITIRWSRAASVITTGWRARDLVNGKVYNIRSVVNAQTRNRRIDILAEEGGAV